MSANRNSIAITNLESNAGHESLGAQETPRFTPPCHIHFHSVRKRLADIDGLSGKAVLDGIVKSGLLQDDSPEFVKSVSHSQTKGKEEYTIITIEEVKE